MMTYGWILENKGFRPSFVATQSDVATVGWGFASALASAGIKYFLKGTWYNSPYSRDLSWVEPAPLFLVGGAGRQKGAGLLSRQLCGDVIGRHVGRIRWPPDQSCG
jgi:hypothetical protein